MNKGNVGKNTIYTINVECDISIDMLDNISPGLNDAKIIVAFIWYNNIMFEIEGCVYKFV